MALIAGLEWGLIDEVELERIVISPCSAHRRIQPGCTQCARAVPSDEWKVPTCDYSRDCPFPSKFWLRPADEHTWGTMGTCITHFLPMVERIHKTLFWLA